MAATVSNVVRAAHVSALTASTVDTVNFSATGTCVMVTMRGAGDGYFTIDGSTPTVGGADTYICLANSSKAIEVGGEGKGAITQVKLVSSGTAPYSVELF